MLGRDDYRRAYAHEPYRTTFAKLWGQERLAFVGFGFRDAWLAYLADEVVARSTALAAESPRHVALIGLREDQPYTPAMRDTFRDRYGAEVIFYQVLTRPDGGQDHGELLAILKALAGPDLPRSPHPP